MEFAISNSIKIHPLALCEPEKSLISNRPNIELTKGYTDSKKYFIDKLAEGFNRSCGFLSQRCYVRMSDFKSNEYANLIGGKYFEPHEENPMIGFRLLHSDFFIEKGLP
jgi:pyruvate,water dikinase